MLKLEDFNWSKYINFLKSLEEETDSYNYDEFLKLLGNFTTREYCDISIKAISAIIDMSEELDLISIHDWTYDQPTVHIQI